jgi:hypothetical protein
MLAVVVGELIVPLDQQVLVAQEVAALAVLVLQMAQTELQIWVEVLEALVL